MRTYSVYEIPDRVWLRNVDVSSDLKDFASLGEQDKTDLRNMNGAERRCFGIKIYTDISLLLLNMIGSALAKWQALGGIHFQKVIELKIKGLNSHDEMEFITWPKKDISRISFMTSVKNGVFGLPKSRMLPVNLLLTFQPVPDRFSPEVHLLREQRFRS